jgi:hypothetical protein
MLSDTGKKRVAQLLPRLASDQPGDVVSSAAALVRVLKSEGKDLHDLAKLLDGKSIIIYRDVFREKPKPQGEWLKKATYCAENDKTLTPKEKEFVSDMAVKLKYQNEPTERQAAWLDAIWHRLQRAAKSQASS